jgi:putative transposase
MPQSLANVLVHVVFSSKDRQPWLQAPALRGAMHRHLAAVSGQLSCPAVIVGGVADHVHILARLARTTALAEWVKELKRVSSLWVKEAESGMEAFHWQAGYGAFSVSQSQSGTVVRYIAQQEEHHRRVTFQGELRTLLTRHAIELDERYVWD